MVKKLLWIGIFILLSIVTINIGMVYGYSVEKEDLGEIILVPGAAVYEDRASPMLEQRLQGALKLYQAKKRPIVLSGAKRASYDEPSVMYAYLIQNGVDKEDLYMDKQGYRTVESMKQVKKYGKKVVIVTQEFHMGRALYLARAMGVHAYPYPLPNRNMVFFGKNKNRERLARVLAFGEGFVYFLQEKVFLKMPFSFTENE